MPPGSHAGGSFLAWSIILTAQEFVKGIVLTADTLSPAQCRMARAALQWSLDEAAKAAGVSYRTIFRLENEQRDIQAEKVTTIAGFEAAW